MRKGGSKAKGASFEREVCKALSLWVSAGKHEDVFWRSAMSGGRSTVAHAKGKRLAAQAGDISCIHPIGHEFSTQFMIECKHYKDLQIKGLITGTGKLIEFWVTAKAEAKRYEKLPILVAKQNQIPTFVCLSRAGVMTLNLGDHVFLTHHFMDINIVSFANYLENARAPTGDSNV